MVEWVSEESLMVLRIPGLLAPADFNIIAKATLFGAAQDFIVSIIICLSWIIPTMQVMLLIWFSVSVGEGDLKLKRLKTTPCNGKSLLVGV